MAILCLRRNVLPVLLLAAFTIPSAMGCERGCDRYEYCDENNNSCRNCSDLCEKDEYSCFHKCQNYLFKSLSEQVSTLNKSTATLRILLGLVLLFFCFAVIVLAVRYKNVFIECCRWRPQGKQSAPVGYTHENPNTKSPKAAPKNGANAQNGPKPRPESTTVSIYPETEADNSVQTGMTSISNRHPAEDSTESYSYDNAACNVTPTSNNPMPRF